MCVFPVQVYVTGLVLSHSIPGVRYQFVRDPSLSGGNVDDVTLCNVEQIALDHYHTVGYPQGVLSLYADVFVR